jgi:glycosyltransferase involved in cell wall biosynthesis
LAQSLDSLLAQTYPDFVLILSDNASTDSTAAICEKYVKADSRVRYFRNPVNIGNPRNFNRLVELTSTKYLKWSTSDDFWEPTFLERAVAVMERDSSIILCYPRTHVVDSGGLNATPYDDNLHLMQADPADRFLGLLDRIGLAHQHLGLIRTSLLRQTHLLGNYYASDVTLLAEMTLYGKFYELPERLFYRRYHETSGSWKRGDVQHQAKYYLGTNKRRTGLPLWRGRLGRIAAVSRSPLPVRSKMLLYRRLVRQMIWMRDELMGELFGRFRSTAQ